MKNELNKKVEILKSVCIGAFPEAGKQIIKDKVNALTEAGFKDATSKVIGKFVYILAGKYNEKEALKQIDNLKNKGIDAYILEESH